MRLGQMGVAAEMTIRFDAYVTETLEPVGFALETTNAIQTIRATGTVEDSTLRIAVATGGAVRTKEVDLDGVDLFGLEELKAARDGFEVGEVIEGRTFDPASLAVVPYRIEVVETAPLKVGTAETVAYVVSFRVHGLETRSWMTADGGMLRSVTPMGMLVVEMKREDERTARTLEARGVTDLVMALAVPAEWPAAVPPRRARKMTVALRGLDGPLEGMDGGVQSIEDAREGEIRLSIDVANPRPGPAPGPDALGPSVYVQADDSRIVEAARKAAGDGTPAERAAALVGWVHRYIEKAPAFTLPSALDVLENPRGDCNEHAVLYAALARAAGIPCRIAAGLVHLDGRFFYHAWNEVWLDGAWRPVDATFDQAEADATHLRLVVGDLDEQMRIASVAGRLTIRVIEAE